MKKTVLGIIVGLVVGVGATWIYLHNGSAAIAGAKLAEATAAPEKPKESPLHLTPAKREASGIVLAKAEEKTIEPFAITFGRVLDATALVTLAAELETGKAAYDASTKELERVKRLFAANNNASAQAVETAEAAAARDRAVVTSARVRLVSGWGLQFSEEKQLLPLIDALAKGQALIRLDVLPGERIAAEPKIAKVSLLGSDDVFDVQILGSAPVADPQVQGASFLALVPDRPLPIGATLRGKIAAKGDAEKALIVPRSAIVYHQGSAWIYVLDEEDTFARKLVTPGQAVGANVALTSGLEAGQQVVTTGAMQLLAAELQAGEAPEEP